MEKNNNKSVLVWNTEVLKIMNDGRLTKQEKMGHLRAMIKKEDGFDKLKQLLKWLVGEMPGRGFEARFDLESRVFTMSFNRDDYFDHGGREYINMVRERMNSLKWPFVSCYGADHWIGYFPHKVLVANQETMAKSEEQAANPPIVVEVKQEPKQEFKPKVARNQKRKNHEIVKVEEETPEDFGF